MMVRLGSNIHGHYKRKKNYAGMNAVTPGKLVVLQDTRYKIQDTKLYLNSLWYYNK